MYILQQPSVLLALLLSTIGLSSTSAFADTLDFTTFSQGAQGSPVMTLPQATITSFGTDIYVGAAGLASEICALGSFGCQADMQIDFTASVNDLTFDLSGYDSGDHIDVSIFSGATLLGTSAYETNGFVDLSGYLNVTRLYFDDSSTGAGFAYDNFQFTTTSTTAVPEPETYAMFLAGLGLLGFSSRRKQA